MSLIENNYAVLEFDGEYGEAVEIEEEIVGDKNYIDFIFEPPRVEIGAESFVEEGRINLEGE